MREKSGLCLRDVVSVQVSMREFN